jgi:hypothetical protein
LNSLKYNPVKPPSFSLSLTLKKKMQSKRI